MSNIIYYSPCSSNFDCDDFEICYRGSCRCQQTYFSDEDGTCRKCPGLGQSCEMSLCCADTAMMCNMSGVCVCRNGIENTITCSAQTPIYITASQIALTAALIMGMAALTMVVYRLCTKPRYLSARQRALASQNGINPDNESLSYANYLRASLTSMQIRVLTRLRDRPPSYDNRDRRPAPAPVPLPQAPPPYEGATDALPQPPAYEELTVSPTGYVNSTFVDPELGSVSRSADSDSISNRNYSISSISIVNRNCDNSPPSDGTRDMDKVANVTIEKKTETSDEHQIPT